MKRIKKIKESSKAVAGTALLVGATLAGGASFALADNHTGGSSGDATLGDYPGHFVNEDGTLSSTVIMGEDAMSTDVVAAAQIAGQLGNNAHTTETQTVSVEGSFGWSAENGVSLDTRNDDIYFGDYIDTVRQTLTEEHLDVLETVEVLSGDEEQDVEQYLYVGHQQVGFDTPGDTDGEEDPFLFVENPADSTVAVDNEDNYLYQLQANFQDGVEFQDTSEDNNRNEDVYGEEVAMFGMDFTVGDASFDAGTEDQLILYGSSEEISVDSGQSETATVGGEEVTIEVVGVTGSNEAAVRINGDLEQYSENDEETIGGEDLRVDNIIQTNADNSQGVVQFAIGSEKVTLQSGEPVMTGEDDEEVDGTMVQLEGTNVNDADSGVDSEVHELSSIKVAVGASDSDEGFVRAGESFEDPVFEDVEFHFGGLNPDASEEGENVGQIEFSTDGDDVATASFSDGDNDATVEFAYEENADNPLAQGDLQDSDGDEIVAAEGQAATEDDYILTDAGDFSHMWEVTSIDVDEADDANTNDEDEGTIELEDQVSGTSVEVDLDAYDPDGQDFDDSDAGAGTDYYRGEEVIDGQTYHFWTDEADGTVDTVYATWDSGSNFDNTGNRVSVFPALDTDSDAAITFAEEVSKVTEFSGVDLSDDDGEFFSKTVELPSTDSSGVNEVEIRAFHQYSDRTGAVDGGNQDDTDTFYVEVLGAEQVGSNGDEGTWIDITGSDTPLETHDQVEFRAGQTVYSLDVNTEDDNVDSAAASFDIGLGSQVDDGSLDNWNDGDTDDETDVTASSLVLQPEDDDDNENGFVVTPGVDDSDDEVDVGGGSGSFTYVGQGSHNQRTLESDDDIEAAYTLFGTYTEQNTDEQGSITLNLPNGQSTAGAAVTGQEGSLSASAGGSGSVDTMMPTGWSNQYVALDSDSSVDQAREDRNLVLVGGPSVNGLVSDLVDANKTMAASEYTEGQGMLQLVEDAFTEGHDALVVAGYSGADTRAAGEFLTNYEENSDALEGSTEVTVNTAEGTVVQ